jgi:spermidine synthase
MPSFSFLIRPTNAQLDDILALYRLAGWWQSAGSTARDRDQVRGIVDGSHCFLIATEASGPEAPVIGMGRSISDGVSDAYIQDVVVSTAHRGRGIATEIIGRIVRRLEGDGIDWIGLVAEKNTRKLYEPLGFSPMADSVPMRYRKK